MSTREKLFEQAEILRSHLARAKEIQQSQADLIQNQAGEIEELNRLLAQAEIKIEELEAELDSAVEQLEER